MAEIKAKKNYMDKIGRKGKIMNLPMGNTGHESSGKLTKKGKVYRNDLLDTDYTRQDMGTVRKTRGV